jgi:hypothetical protein
MGRKKEPQLTHPGRSHPAFTVEEARQRELQRQRDKRARWKSEKSLPEQVRVPSGAGLGSLGTAAPVAPGESASKELPRSCLSL